MESVQRQVEELSGKIREAIVTAKIGQLEQEDEQLTKEASDPQFWNDSLRAQEVTRRQVKLKTLIEPLRQLEKDVNDLKELARLGDASMTEELVGQIGELENRYSEMQLAVSLSGQYDDHDAVVELRAGAGGTDAQDWTKMLERMYLRWAQAHKMKTEIVDKSAGEEAGIKSESIVISGQNAYGLLKGEHGVHRLVRLSPFNADHLRQTSFAMVEVLPQIDRPEELPLDEKDLKIDVFRAGGHGGQSVNTTDSAVRVTHVPTGIVVTIQNERSQLQNKETALKILRSRLAQLQLVQHKERIDELKGPNQSAEWGNQIRSYVLHPYTLVKDNRTKHEEHDAQRVLDGDLDPFINSYLTSSTK
ncbi:MAG TPA: peptide chain release factor 2 [Candidatus Saccharimonadales bacterium]|nr:peptide chain release factor 2 [Candidatus Saccharimonadales bacterium]